MIYSNGVAIITIGEEVHIKFLTNIPSLEGVDLEKKGVYQGQINIKKEEVAHIILPIKVAKSLRDGLVENISTNEEMSGRTKKNES